MTDPGGGTFQLTPVVKVGEVDLSADELSKLSEIRVEREFQLPGRVTLRFWDVGYTLLSSTFKLGSSVVVTSDPDSTDTLITAEVTSIAIEHDEFGSPQLVVVGHDRSHRLGRSTTVKAFVSQMYSDVVGKLAGEAGLTASTDSTEQTVDYLMQCDSDLGLLTELARRVGFDWWVDGTTLHFKKPASTGTVALAYGDNLRSFSVRASGNRPDAVQVVGWDRTQQQVVTATASSPSSGLAATSDIASLVANPASAFGTGTIKTAGINAQSTAEATQLSQALLDHGSGAAIEAKGVTIGPHGSIIPGVSVQVSGVGPLSGTYPVARVEHIYRIGSGYLTRFSGGDRWPTSLVDTLAGRRAGPTAAHLHAGLAVGQVTNNNDPNSTGRVKVRFPGLSTEYESGWARIVSTGGGANRGSVFIPEVDDEVLVAFEGGDPRQPVIIGGLFGAKSTIPPPSIQDGKVEQRGMTSRLGHVITLFDGTEPSKQAVLLQLAGAENLIRLGKDKLDVTVPSGTPINITAGSSSIAFGQDGSISIKAPTITIEGQTEVKVSAPNITVSADAQLSLQGQAQAALKGGMVQVQAEGPAMISGEPVMIN